MSDERTALGRAISALKDAAGDRPFVLVVERALKAAPVMNVTVHRGKDQSGWETLGLLEMGCFIEKRRLARPPEDRGDDWSAP